MPAYGADWAAELAAALLADTMASLTPLDWEEVIISTSDPQHEFWANASVPIWDQGGGDLGRRISTTLLRGLERADSVLAIGADSPGLPVEQLHRARAALQEGRSVLGPAEDGGFYLLGIHKCPSGLLDDIPWSTPETGARTLARLTAFGMDPVTLDPWFDVDRSQDLNRLLDEPAISAPNTRRVLECRPSYR